MKKLGDLFATCKLLFVYVVLGVPLGIVGIPYSILVKDVTRLYWASMWVTGLGIRAAGIRIRRIGFDNIPVGRPCIFMANHVSNLDPPVLMPVIPTRSSVLLKKELMSIPILGTAMKLGGFIPVERGSRRDTAQASVAAASKAIADGLNIVVFPEGTRSPDGRLSNFKKGPFFLAIQTGAPIVPVAISGTETMMRKGSSLITPAWAEIHMLPAIEPGQYATREELMAAVRNAIAGALPVAMKPANGPTT